MLSKLLSSAVNSSFVSKVKNYFFVYRSHYREVPKHKTISNPNAPNEKPKIELVHTTVKRTLEYPPLQDVVDFDHTASYFVRKLKRTGPAFLVAKILQKFRDTFGRDPHPNTRSEDIQKLLIIRDEIGKDLVPDAAFGHVFGLISPAAAIVGGEISQEIIKAVSQKEVPHSNVFLFDPIKCCGFVEAIGC